MNAELLERRIRPNIVQSIDFEYRRFWQDEFATLLGDPGKRQVISGEWIHVLNDYLPTGTRFDSTGAIVSGPIFYLTFVNALSTVLNKVIPLYGRQKIQVPEGYNEFFMIGTNGVNVGSATAAYLRSMSSPIELLISKHANVDFADMRLDTAFDWGFRVTIPASTLTRTVIWPLPTKGIRPEINVQITNAPTNPVSFTIGQVDQGSNALPVEYTENPVTFPYNRVFVLEPHLRTLQMMITFTFGGAAEEGLIDVIGGYRA